MATTLKISANRVNMADPLPLSFGLELGIFKHRGARVHCHQMRARIPTLARVRPRTTILCNTSHKPGKFDIEEARRVPGNVFAPWVQDLGLSIGSIECAPSRPPTCWPMRGWFASGAP